MIGRIQLSMLLALVLAACASAPQADRILEDGDCGTVPDVERLAIMVSDRGTKVSFRWTRTRFAGMVLAGSGPVEKGSSYGANQPGVWERRFPDASATTTVPGSFLGFPAAANARAGVLAAAVYDERYPAPGTSSSAVVVVDLRSRGTQFVGGRTHVDGIAWSPNGDYFAVLESAPTARMSGWRDLFSFASPPPTAQYDVHATIYSASGLAACSRRVGSGLPAPTPGIGWD
ncbi:MAG: hypothetical protein U1F15_11865 [Burkholderiales bacterium]